jgi:hypothetical protein
MGGLRNVSSVEKRYMSLPVKLRLAVENIVREVVRAKVWFIQCLQLGGKAGEKILGKLIANKRKGGRLIQQRTRDGKEKMLDILEFMIGLRKSLENQVDVKYAGLMIKIGFIIGPMLAGNIKEQEMTG